MPSTLPWPWPVLGQPHREVQGIRTNRGRVRPEHQITLVPLRTLPACSSSPGLWVNSVNGSRLSIPHPLAANPGEGSCSFHSATTSHPFPIRARRWSSFLSMPGDTTKHERCPWPCLPGSLSPTVHLFGLSAASRLSFPGRGPHSAPIPGPIQGRTLLPLRDLLPCQLFPRNFQGLPAHRRLQQRFTDGTLPSAAFRVSEVWPQTALPHSSSLPTGSPPSLQTLAFSVLQTRPTASHFSCGPSPVFQLKHSGSFL